MGQPFSNNAFALGLLCCALALGDTVTVSSGGSSIIYQHVKVSGETNGRIRFDAGGGPVDKAIGLVSDLRLNDEPELAEAEELFDAGKFENAAEKYEGIISKNARPWLGDYCLGKVVDSWNKVGRFDKAANAYSRLATRNFELTAYHVPVIPDKASKYLKPGMQALLAAANAPELAGEKRDVLLGLIQEIDEPGAATQPWPGLAADAEKYRAAIANSKWNYSPAVYQADKDYLAAIDLQIHGARSQGPVGLIALRKLRRERADIQNHLARMPIPRNVTIDQKELFSQDASTGGVIFVCDATGSMGGPKVDLLRDAMNKAIAMLSPEQTFNVIIMQLDEQNHPFQSIAEKLMPADIQNEGTALDFLNNTLTCHGITDEFPAIAEAIHQQPQAIYILSDGEFEDGPRLLKKLLDINPDQKVHINTILIAQNEKDANDESKIMQQIAKTNNGVFAVWLPEGVKRN